jgi:hypothetical protein
MKEMLVIQWLRRAEALVAFTRHSLFAVLDVLNLR